MSIVIVSRAVSNPNSLGYVLIDPRPIAAESPYTFFLPNADELAAVAKGDLVKLIFEYVPAGQKWAAERMWVEVDYANANELNGTLENEPSEPTALIRKGDQVIFQRHNVVSIVWAIPETAPLASVRREYWERCLVDDCVLNGKEPVEFIYREEPDIQQEGDRYPDSGWRIRGRVGEATDDEVNVRTFSYIAIGAVLNRDDSWAQFIDAPMGTRLMRDFNSNTFILKS